MLVPHAAWAPAGAGESSELFLWAEAEGEAPWRPALASAVPGPAGPGSAVPGPAGPGSPDVRLHPRCASPAALRDALAPLGLEGALVGATATLLLPTGPSDRAAPVGSGAGPAAASGVAASDPLRGPAGLSASLARPSGAATLAAAVEDEVEPLPSLASGEEGRRATGLRPWRVGGLRVGLVAAAPWLAGLAADARAQPDGPALAADLRYWARAAAFALDLLRAEQVVPSLDRRPDGDLQAVWRPLLSGQAERRRLRALAEAMPPAVRAVVADGGTPPPEELLGDFLRAAVDALARGWLAEAAWPEARWLAREGTGMPAAVGRWLEALAATRPAAARLTVRRAGDLARDVAAWTDPSLGVGAAFRLCLRLVPPGGATPPGRPVAAVNGLQRSQERQGAWRLDYLLQAVDDPAVLVPAGQVWPIERAVASLAGRRVVEPQELLLADLARAARHVPAIATGLAEPHPSGADLTVEEAYRFLREAVVPLSEAGVGVLAPSWWTRREARRRLGVSVRLAPASPGDAGGGAFGLQSLVEYDWRLALGDEELTAEEFDRLVRLKVPLVQLRGEWVELDPAALEQALRYWQSRASGAMPLAEAARLAAGLEATGLPIEKVEAESWLADVLGQERRLAELPEPSGFVGQLRAYQRRGFAWLTFMRQHRLGACLADDMGLGKCIVDISKIVTNGILHTMEDLWATYAERPESDGEGVWAEPREPLTVDAIDEESGRIVTASVRRLYRQRVRERLRRVTLEDGNSVTITRSHRLLTSRGWTNELSVGDCVCVPARTSWLGQAADRELLTLLAWQIGEGWENPRSGSVVITQGDRARLDELRAVALTVASRHGLRLNVPTVGRHGSRAAHLRFCSVAYRRFLEARGYRWGRRSREKEIPPLVMTADPDGLRLFLRAYFDAEGSVSARMRSVEISSTSPTLMHQLSVLLRRFGIWLRVSTKRRRATHGSGIVRDYRIGLLGGNAARRFRDEIGFGDPRKQARLEEICRVVGNTNVEGIPASAIVAETVRRTALPLRHFGMHNPTYLRGTQQFSRASLTRVLAGYDRVLSGETEREYRAPPPSKWTRQTLDAYARLDAARLIAERGELGRMVDREVFYCRIKSIEEVEYDGWVYDLEVDGHHNYVAENILCHNTVQTTALFLHDRAGGQEGTVLIVCPASVLGNWQRELARFGPALRVMMHHGPARTGQAEFAEVAGRHDIVLTTYALLHRDEARLGEVAWAGLVLDEAQNVKNAGARTSRAARRLKAGYRLALTGTPVENRLGELWSIMEVLNPGFLGSAEAFRRRFAVPIERDRDADRADELRRLVGPLILRRLKTDPAVIRDLPEKLELKDYPPLTREQASLYEAVVRDMLTRIRESEGVERRGLILAALTKLKQVCNHPAHYLGDGSALAGRSGKLMRLEEMLEEAIADGDHTLVFTQFAEWGGRLRTHLGERLGCEVLYLHGGTPVPERDRIVQRFQAAGGPPVFVLSLRAGGVGLNLTRANRVVHYDRWWNPAVEAQATDRAFRIGQTRNVQVHAFVCAGTLEERIDELIESKRALAEAVIGAGESWLTELSTDELRSLLELRQAVIVDA